MYYSFKLYMNNTFASNFKFNKWSVKLFVIYFQLDVTGDASAIIGLKNTPSCPATAEEWQKQAKIWKCESIKTIAKATLKYHCLLNHWRNETLEFCGEEKTIIGKKIIYTYGLYSCTMLVIFHQFDFMIMCHSLYVSFFKKNT